MGNAEEKTDGQNSASPAGYAVRICVPVRTASSPWRDVWKDYRVPIPPFIGMTFNLGSGCFDDVLKVTGVQCVEATGLVMVHLEQYDLSGQQGICLDADGWVSGGDPYSA